MNLRILLPPKPSSSATDPTSEPSHEVPRSDEPQAVPARWRTVASRLAGSFASWLRETFGEVEFSTADPCVDCGTPCANVTRLETSPLCTGPLSVAQCAECVGVVELDGHPNYHTTANQRFVPAAVFYGRSA